MRPVLTFIEDELKTRVIDEAKSILCETGMQIRNRPALTLLADHGNRIDGKRMHVRFTEKSISQALSTVPGNFKLYDIKGNETHHFIGREVHFTPGSSALKILDHKTKNMRRVTTSDYIKYAKLVSGLPLYRAQSTAMVPCDIHQEISDSYRLFLSLLYCDKPVITGSFTIHSVKVMRDFLLAVRGSENSLAQKPLAVFTCCPLSPLKWGEVTPQNLLDLAEFSIPVEIVSMPLSGFNAPVTLIGTLTQLVAEILSGIVIGQLAKPGLPMLWGGSPATFDIRYETTPLGAPETIMINCANNEIGKFLGIPTQAYISLSDSKRIDAQAGLETSMGATLAALSGINSISGPGMLDFENCQSLEKLVVDHEICTAASRLVRGFNENETFPIILLIQELMNEQHLLIADHTRKYLRREHTFPGPVIDRTTEARFLERGGYDLEERAHREVVRIINDYTASGLSGESKHDIVNLMKGEALKFGQQELPDYESD
jgi:trimethylamine---corrinoid protein Co-methyltransferase